MVPLVCSRHRKNQDRVIQELENKSDQRRRNPREAQSQPFCCSSSSPRPWRSTGCPSTPCNRCSPPSCRAAGHLTPRVQAPPSNLLSPQNPLSPVSGKAALQADVVLHDGGGGGVLVVTSFLQQAQAPLNGDPGDLLQDSSKTQDPWGKASASSLL